MDVIFMETAMRLSDARSHALIDCIPVQPAVTAKAPLYFKKGIDDAESEWSQHHAKRMIETGGKVCTHSHKRVDCPNGTVLNFCN